MQIYFAILFSLVALAAAAIQWWPTLKINREQPFLLPLAAMLAIDLVALLAPAPINLLYKGAILLGMVLATLAVAFYRMPKIPSYVPVAFFFVIYFLNLLAFLSAYSPSIPTPIPLLILAYAVVLFWLGRAPLREAQGAFAGYLVLMSLMLWASSEMWARNQQLWASAAFAGAILLAASTAVLLAEKSHKPVPWSDRILVATFFLGQLLIAWSIWGLGASPA